MSSVSEKEFNDLLIKHRTFIIRQVRRRGGGDDTEDFVQDVMLQVCRVRDRYDPDKGAFSTWLDWQIRSCLQQRRLYARKRLPLNLSIEVRTEEGEEGELIREASVPCNQLDHLELMETVREVFNLKPRQAHVVLQRAVGSEFNEIAETYGATAQYAQELHKTGLRNLRKQIARKEIPLWA